jgi:hypothetical protein
MRCVLGTSLGFIVFCGSPAVSWAGVASLGVLHADPAEVPAPPIPSPGGGYGPRDGTGFDGVLPGDQMSMRLRMHDLNGGVVSINGGGEVLVTRGPNLTDLGINRNGPSRVMASWDSIVTGGRAYIIAFFRLTNINDQFMPPGANNNGVPAFAWAWSLGMTDPINWSPFVTSVRIRQALAFFSNDLGTTYTVGSFDFTGNLPSGEWVPARDPGLLMPNIGDGTNAILLSYELDIVPTPGVAAALACAGVFALRRRRSRFRDVLTGRRGRW